MEVGDSSTVNSVITKLKLKSPELIKLSKSQLLIPGLIDTHIHAPQYPNCGLGYDKTLMDWLQTYTFPLEKKYKDLDFSKIVYDALVVCILLLIQLIFSSIVIIVYYLVFLNDLQMCENKVE